LFSYLSVGIALMLFRFLQAKHLIADEKTELIAEANQATPLT
jgi:hypothetical protein